jgi:8-oxo-dGTP diphosphatase
MREKNPRDKAKRPQIGLGVLVVRDKKILLSRRLKPYGFGKLALPGGHVEWMETLIDTARREVLEETGIRLGRIYNLYVYSEEVHPTLGKHYMTFYMIAKCPEGQEPKNMEPKKHAPWRWYDPFNLPRNTWKPTKRLCGPEAKGGSGDLIRAFIDEELAFKE